MTTPDPAAVVSDAERQQVLDQLCLDLGGHEFNFSGLFPGTDLGGYKVLKDGAGELLPYITCSRCTNTWILVPEPGKGYDDAEMKLRDRVYAADKLNKRPTRPRLSGKK